MLIYFATPLFSLAERLFNKNLTLHLEVQGFTVFLPQCDGVEKNKPLYSSMTYCQKELKNSKKLLIGLQTDSGAA